MSENSFYSAMYLAKLLYEVSFDNEDDFAEIGLIAYQKIGNKKCKLYRYIAHIDPQTHSIELPCNADIIEAVTYLPEDWKRVDGVSPSGDFNSAFIEQYIESDRVDNDPLYLSGELAKYELVGKTLYFTPHHTPYHVVKILYKGELLDDDGLPILTDKESFAIATFVAYVQTYKKGLSTNNGTLLQVAQQLEQKWRIACDLARTPEYLSQNDFDRILDVKSSWNRKSHNISYKPIY